jgi:hypothetical protein
VVEGEVEGDGAVGLVWAVGEGDFSEAEGAEGVALGECAVCGDEGEGVEPIVQEVVALGEGAAGCGGAVSPEVAPTAMGRPEVALGGWECLG